MKNQSFWMGFAVAAGLVVSSFVLKSAVENYRDRDRVVSVKGLCERSVAADYVIWPLVYKEVGNNLPEIIENVTRKNNEVRTFLEQKGINADEISSSAPAVIDLEADRYRTEKAPYRYNVTSVITVASDKVELVRQLMSQQSELMEKGIVLTQDDYQYQTIFSYNGLNDIKPEMIEQATKNAREAALKFADDSGSKLGKIRTADQGTFSIMDRDNNTPYVKTVRVVTRVDYFLKD